MQKIDVALVVVESSSDLAKMALKFALASLALRLDPPDRLKGAHCVRLLLFYGQD